MRKFAESLDRRLANHRYLIALAGILLYNNWILGIFINPPTTLAGATISELGIPGQPGAGLFRILDVIAGVLFLLGIGAVVNLAAKSKIRLVLTVGMLSLSISTIVESFIPLDCSSALNKICLQQERLGLVSWQHNVHIIESVITYGLMFLLPLGVFLAIRAERRNYALKKWSLGLMIFMILWAAESAVRFSQGAGSFGYEQRLFVVLFSVWYWEVIRSTKRLD